MHRLDYPNAFKYDFNLAGALPFPYTSSTFSPPSPDPPLEPHQQLGSVPIQKTLDWGIGARRSLWRFQREWEGVVFRIFLFTIIMPGK